MEHRQAVHAGEMASAIVGADETMRSWLKHGHTFATAEEAIKACRGLLLDVVPVAHGVG